MPTIDEIRAELKKFKDDNPHVDWDVHEPYAVQDQNTGEVTRMGYARKDRFMALNGEDIL